MKKNHTIKLAEYFYSSHYLPILVLNEKKEVLENFSVHAQKLPIFRRAIEALKTQKDFPTILEVPQLGIFGAVEVKQGQSYLLMGPCFTHIPNEENILLFMRAAAIDYEKKPEIMEFLSSIPPYSYNQFINLLSFLELLINKREVDISRFSFNQTQMEKVQKEQMSERFSSFSTEHRTYYYEQQLLAYVEKGDLGGLHHFIEESLKQRFNEGKVADNEIRQAKNILNGVLVMLGKVAGIQGGMDIEEAYRLIDSYTQECERCSNVTEIKNLQYNALIDFTSHVASAHQETHYSADVNTAIHYTKSHINRVIGVMDVVSFVGTSRSSLLQKFKQETGMTLGAFIMDCKLQESTMLLKFSEKSLSDIASYLGFSTQSYFQNTFKKKFEMTPLKYREMVKAKTHS